MQQFLHALGTSFGPSLTFGQPHNMCSLLMRLQSRVGAFLAHNVCSFELAAKKIKTIKGVHTDWWCTMLQVPYCFRTPCSCSAPTQFSMQQQLFVSSSHRGQDGVSCSCPHDGSHLNFRLDCLLCAKCASHFMALGIKSS